MNETLLLISYMVELNNVFSIAISKNEMTNKVSTVTEDIALFQFIVLY